MQLVRWIFDAHNFASRGFRVESSTPNHLPSHFSMLQRLKQNPQSIPTAARSIFAGLKKKNLEANLQLLALADLYWFYSVTKDTKKLELFNLSKEELAWFPYFAKAVNTFAFLRHGNATFGLCHKRKLFFPEITAILENWAGIGKAEPLTARRKGSIQANVVAILKRLHDKNPGYDCPEPRNDNHAIELGKEVIIEY
jgi:hypothetical protein